MNSIMGQNESEHPELFALEFGKIAKYDFVYTLSSSTNIYQSTPNLVKMYVIIRSCMSLIMDLIRPELYELSALELENLPYLTVYTLASANIDQSVPNLATIYVPVRSLMRSIVEQIKLEHLELFALEFGKIADSNFVYTLASTNINQSAPNFRQNVCDHKISDEFDYGFNPTRTELLAVEFAKIAESDFTL